MTQEQIKALFPLKGMITQNTIDTVYRWDVCNCIGATTLKNALGADNVKAIGEKEITWGAERGQIDGIVITTVGKIDLFQATFPQEVTFIVA